MKNKKKILLSLLLVAIICLVVVCVIHGVRNLGKQKKIVMIPKVIDEDNDFWSSLLEGTRMAAEEYHTDLEIIAPQREDNYQEQITLIEEVIEQKPDAIVLTPISYSEMTDTVKKIKEAGISLVMVDSDVDEKVEDVLISTDNFEAGNKMGEYLREHLPEDPVIGIVAHVKGSSTALERENGFRSGLGEEYENDIVGTIFTDSDYEKGYRVTKEFLEEHPDVNVLAGLNEYAAVAAARAVKDMGLTDQIMMIGFDSSIEEIQYLEMGIFDAIVIQKPFNMGYLGVEAAVNLMEGATLAQEIDSGSVLITKDTIYTEENEKLLFPFHEENIQLLQ